MVFSRRHIVHTLRRPDGFRLSVLTDHRSELTLQHQMANHRWEDDREIAKIMSAQAIS